MECATTPILNPIFTGTDINTVQRSN
ncbi:hypothetical protein LDHU3_23.1810:CDS1 [Leishmania donovani]|nr:hypothetical protein LDHU3_23.1810:CDS1 [Leishmania donovani]